MKVIRSEVEGRRDRKRERSYQRRYARRHGYFWLPCPLCGEEFGGHEAHGSIATEDPDRREDICPSCTAERQDAAERYLEDLGERVVFATTRWGASGWMSHSVPSIKGGMV